jgi:isopentenyl diphosphate isomerase/L-lactate dehydrogenase-like FMN-dependent dehydrogenase
MRARLIVLGALAVVFAAGAVILAWGAAVEQVAGQAIAAGTLSAEEAAREQHFFLLSFAMQAMIAPTATAAAFAGVAILAVLARRQQLRRAQLQRLELSRRAPAR